MNEERLARIEEKLDSLVEKVGILFSALEELAEEEGVNIDLEGNIVKGDGHESEPEKEEEEVL